MEMLDADGFREGWWVVGFGQGHRALPAGSLIPPAFFSAIQLQHKQGN